MGTFYTLGVIEKFTAQSEQELSEEKWKQILNERINIEFFETSFTHRQVSGVLRDKIFENNIEDFYCKLKKITNAPDIDYYFRENGTQISDYDSDGTRIHLCDDENRKITIDFEYILLFIEGKVLVEEFSIEPKLINWLFKHCNFGNCLAGSIISAVCG